MGLAMTRPRCLDEKGVKLFSRRLEPRHYRLAERYRVHPFMAARYEELLGLDGARALLEMRPSDILRAIRVNTLRTSVDALQDMLEEKGFVLERYWIPYALIVREEPIPIGATHEYMEGLYYIQGAGSQTPVYMTDPKPLQYAIDLCAAPGGKTSQIAQHQRDTTPIIAVDVSARRLQALKNNMNRLGVRSVIALHMDARDAPSILGGARFEYVLLDAPCTGEGLLPLEKGRREQRRPEDLADRICLQMELLEAAVRLAACGATIIYTTCSIAPEENEYVVSRILERHPEVEPVEPAVKPPVYRRGVKSFNGVEFDSRVSRCIRLYPHETGTEGFTICVLRKRCVDTGGRG